MCAIETLRQLQSTGAIIRPPDSRSALGSARFVVYLVSRVAPQRGAFEGFLRYCFGEIPTTF